MPGFDFTDGIAQEGAGVLRFLHGAQNAEWGPGRAIELEPGDEVGIASGSELSEASSHTSSISCMDLMRNGECLRGIRVQGAFPFPPAILMMALTQNEQFNPDPATLWRKAQPIQGLVQGRVICECFGLPGSGESKVNSAQISERLEPHNYLVATWSRDGLFNDSEVQEDVASTSGQGSETYIGEFYELLPQHCGRQPSRGTEWPSHDKGSRVGLYTCLVAMGGITQEHVSALETHMEGKIGHMQRTLREPTSQELLKQLAEAAENEDTDGLQELCVAFVTKDVMRELSAELQDRVLEKTEAKLCIPLKPVYSALKCVLGGFGSSQPK